MIAPRRKTSEPSVSTKNLARARHLVAATLLEEQAQDKDALPHRTYWKMWALAAGVLAIVAVMIAFWMARLLS